MGKVPVQGGVLLLGVADRRVMSSAAEIWRVYVEGLYRAFEVH